MKRKAQVLLDCVSSCTRSKKPKLMPAMTWEKRRQYWISATQTRNFMINDPLVDWFKTYTRNSS